MAKKELKELGKKPDKRHEKETKKTRELVEEPAGNLSSGGTPASS